MKQVLGLVVFVLAGQAQNPLAPTAENELPAPILGQTGPPRGSNLAYFGENPKAVGYLAVPEGEGPFDAVILNHEWNDLVREVRSANVTDQCCLNLRDFAATDPPSLRPTKWEEDWEPGSCGPSFLRVGTGLVARLPLLSVTMQHIRLIIVIRDLLYKVNCRRP